VYINTTSYFYARKEELNMVSTLDQIKVFKFEDFNQFDVQTHGKT